MLFIKFIYDYFHCELLGDYFSNIHRQSSNKKIRFRKFFLDRATWKVGYVFRREINVNVKYNFRTRKITFLFFPWILLTIVKSFNNSFLIQRKNHPFSKSFSTTYQKLLLFIINLLC